MGELGLKYYEVETKSHTRKSHGFRLFYAKNKDEVVLKMKKLRLPIFNIRTIKK